ncbi:MAG: tRNA (adenosine(37)-N6)-threonylcarbamoyltransferase complex ATPase subunit type 1 TsaE [Pseudobdellovibrio sp.]|nr:tRNA (adenosine(37)-N6)-threonylcarbamoyltransferase complex ATPase subunit type 1 TsaE [Pseudobdellovibrio sp.]
MSRDSIVVQSMSDWDKVVSALSAKLRGKNLFLLEGNLGAGKTTLVGLIAKKLNIPMVASPTFSLISQHKNLIHVDLYRLESMEEIDATGFWEIFEDEDSMVFVEWSSKISDDLWPLDWDITKITINKISETEREVLIETVA